MLTKIIETIANALAAKEKLNTAQQLVQGWCEKRPPYAPTKPRLIYVVVQTDKQHETREGAKCERWALEKKKVGGKEITVRRRVPVMLKYAAPVDRRKVYPYSSTRQNTRRARRFDAMALAA